MATNSNNVTKALNLDEPHNLPFASSSLIHCISFYSRVGAMESLLSHSFDHLSSNDPGKIRKGLKQLEGLLAQICLSRSGSDAISTADKRRSIATSRAQDLAPKELVHLKDDAAFREFFKLQEGFQWNGKSVFDELRQC